MGVVEREKRANRLSPRLLTAGYGGLQGFYWMVYCGLFTFAAAFLMDRGYSASQTGVLLALATLLSCVLQPLVASLADKSARVSLKAMLLVVLACSGACLLCLRLLPLSRLPFAALYLLGALLLDLAVPLINALAVYYTDRGVALHYGVGRGVGSLAFAFASWMLGLAMERFGANVMLTIAVCLFAALLLVAALFPRVEREKEPANQAREPAQAPCSLPVFFTRYKRYCVSLLGVLFLLAFHSMNQNYMVAILGRVGGGSGDLGVAIAISTICETPMVMLFSRIQKKARCATWLIIAAMTYVLRATLLFFAPSVLSIKLIQVLQAGSYGLYVPLSVIYARESVRRADMVKGQAMISAAYALGCSLGNFVGGRLLDISGVRSLLLCGVGFTVAGLVVFLITGRRQSASAVSDAPSSM